MTEIREIKLSDKQIEILRVLDDPTHTEIFMGGAAGGCPLLGSEVITIDGPKRIEDIKKGDLVLSYDEKKGEMTYNKVVDTFKKGVRLKCIEVKINGTIIKITADHRFLYEKSWTTLRELIRRILEKNRQKWNVLDKQQRKINNPKLEEYWKNVLIQTSNDQEGLFENSISFKRKKQISSDSQISSEGIYSKSSKQTPSKSQRLQQEKQFSGKFRVGNKQGEFSSCREKRIDERIYESGWKSGKFTNKKGFGQWNEQTNRTTSQRDKTKIHPKKIWEKTSCDRIQSKTKHYKGYYHEKELEACEINLDLIEEIKFFFSEVPAFDLEVENTYSYVLSKEKIIIHNSKSFTGCYWQIKRRLTYPGSRGFLARARLKSLKESTLLTFFEVARLMGLQLNGKNKYDFSYNAITGLIKFNNGSEEYLRDLFYYPSDPEFVGLGSTEYTDGFIDEMAEINEQAYQIIRSRMRFKLDQFGLIPKIAMGSNPCKTFIYKEFYKKWEENKLEPWKAYIRADVYDNPFISKHYIDNLKKLDPINRARLLEGDWHYEDDPTKLFDYDSIIDLFTNEAQRGEKYCTVDVAGRGRDRTILINWDGLFVTKVKSLNNISTQELDEHLKKYQIPRSHCLIDEDGVGFGLVKDTNGVKGFVNNSRPIMRKKESEKEQVTHNYANLKAQCWFLLSNYVNSGMMGIYPKIDIQIRKLLIEDLEQIKEKDPGRDRPLRILTKEDIKEVLGRSTDIGDALMMRMYFELKKPMGIGFLDLTKNIKSEEEIKKQKKEELDKQEKIKKLIEEGKIGFGPSSRRKVIEQ